MPVRADVPLELVQVGRDVGRPGPQLWMRFLAVLPGGIAGAWLILSSAVDYGGQRFFTLVDDALISMSYARTLVDTGEFAWYPGAPRVEGITNPLQALLMTVPQALGLDESASALAMSWWGLLSVLATALLAGLLAGRLGAGTSGQLATTAAVALTWPLLFWSVFGMEVGAIAALGLAIAWLAAGFDRSGHPGAVLGAIAVLSATGLWLRMDFLVSAGVVAAWLVALPSARVSRTRRAAVLFGSLASAVALMSIARYWYFGALLPNTYTLKVEGTSTLDRLSRSLPLHPEMWLLIAVAAGSTWLLWRQSDRRARWPVALVGLLAMAQFAYGFYTGGDAFVPDRFFISATVASAVLAISAADHWGRQRSATLATAAPALVSLALIGAISAGGFYEVWQRGAGLPPYDKVALIGGKQLSEVAKPDATIAVFGAGAATYWGQRPAIDLLGKNDPVVANGPLRRSYVQIPGHDKWDYAHSIGELQPDMVAGDLLNPSSTSSTFFPPTPEEAAMLTEQYERLCVAGSPVLVRKDTTRVVRSGLSPCPA